MTSDDKLEIGLWVSPPASEATAERYAEIKEAGFTFAIGLLEYDTGGDEAIAKAMDAAFANGLKYIVHDPKLKKLTAEEAAEIRERVSRFSGHPAYLGHLLKDEPSAEEIDALAVVKAVYAETAPDGLAYVNLFPRHAAPELLLAEYPDYVEKYMNVYRPQVLSYDHYPFLTENSVFDGDRLTEDYYDNLEIIRGASVRYGTPFWLFIQTLSFNGTHRDPTEAEIRWQVYTSLAFGAKGIQYFTYWTPDDGKESFGEAIIGRDGKRTRHYAEVRAVNREVAAIGAALLPLGSEGVIFWGEHPIPAANSLDRFDPVEAVEGDAVAMGCFSDAHGTPAVLLVNGSYEKNAAVTVKLREGAFDRADIVSGEDAATVGLAGESPRIDLALKPGEGKLVAFRKKP